MLRLANQNASVTATAVVNEEIRAIHTSGGRAGILVLHTNRITIAHKTPTSIRVTAGRVRPRHMSTKVFIGMFYFGNSSSFSNS